MPIEDYSKEATAEYCQSYVSSDGGEWDDITTLFSDTNICIKAFTSDAFLVPTNYRTIQSAVDAARAGKDSMEKICHSNELYAGLYHS